MPSLNPFLDADRELERRVTNFLAGQHVPALRAIQVRASNGAVTLRGHVLTFFEKQLGNHSARRVAGVQQVIDEVEVVWPTETETYVVTPNTRRRGTGPTPVLQVSLPTSNRVEPSPAINHSAVRAFV